MDKKILIGVGIVFLIGILLVFRSSITGNIVGEGDLIKIPLSEISEKADFYEHDGIEYFVVQANDRIVKTAFDACDVCYKSGKGYRQQGGDMICNNCGNVYPISGLGTENQRGGGCWPGYLPSEVEGGNLIIKKSDLEIGRHRFQ